ncbi:MAG: mucoidy inhibitor MuiA family protein [Deltaproteobacteria bacterium]|nr:mucoidy inhibitor MuiA family protein [Deltaproteobacteria bacterium]
MKILSLFCFLFILSQGALSYSADLKRIAAPSKMTSVIVYTDRALTTRSASLSLNPGSYLIAFENLPVLIQDDSVRVEGRGSAGAKIVGLEVKRAFLEHIGEKRVKELDDEIRGLELRSGALDAKRAGLTSQKAFLESIRVAWGDRISKELAIGRPTSEEMRDASRFVGAEVTRIEEATREIEAEKKSIRDKIDALQRQRNESTGSRRKGAKSVEVLLEINREGSLTLDLAVVVPRAGWQPSYDVRLAPDAKSAELTFRAMVRQATGEDWNRIDLTLSTARPAAGGAPPELRPWRIAFVRPQPPMVRPMTLSAPAPSRAKKAAGMQEDGLKAEDSPSEESSAAFATAQISDEHSSVAFRIPGTLDIPSDGTQHGTVVAIEQLPVSMEFMAVPKLAPQVFLRSEIVNRTAYPLLPGKMNAFVGNTYTGSSALRKVASGEKFDLFFGADDRVTVKREELKQHKQAGLFGKNRVSYSYRTEVNNFHKEPVVVTLRDQLPVAGDEEIKVSLEEPSLKPDEVKSDGTVTWKVPLRAGEKKALTFVIVVEYPKDRDITGL